MISSIIHVITILVIISIIISNGDWIKVQFREGMETGKRYEFKEMQKDKQKQILLKVGRIHTLWPSNR